jgi:hypothetical protein
MPLHCPIAEAGYVERGRRLHGSHDDENTQYRRMPEVQRIRPMPHQPSPLQPGKVRPHSVSLLARFHSTQAVAIAAAINHRDNGLKSSIKSGSAAITKADQPNTGAAFLRLQIDFATKAHSVHEAALGPSAMSVVTLHLEGFERNFTRA